MRGRQAFRPLLPYGNFFRKQTRYFCCRLTQKDDMKNSIDFGKENVSLLFKKIFYPTLLGMLFSALFVITDGIFVGRGLGSDALAAVNIVAPIWLFATGIGLMFGMGASVVASIHLAKGEIKAARINMTQAILVSSLFLFICSAFILVFTQPVLQLLGCSEKLSPLATAYLIGFAPFLALNALLCSGGFFIRLSGSPAYSMICSIVAAILNVILDFVFIFILKWGIAGAAIATSLGSAIGAIMMLYYLFGRKHQLHFIPIKLSSKSLKLTVRNIGYMCNLGFSSFLCEASVASMMLCGNYVFIRLLGESGVAAFSIACYFFPIVFMLYTSIAQSAQPIISYNYGIRDKGRIRKAFIIALKTSFGCGIILFLATACFSSEIVSMFISAEAPAHAIAAHGLPLFAIGFIPFAANMVSIGYFQSVEQVKKAIFVTIMRGFILLILSFIIFPQFIGIEGAWLAVPIAEILTSLIVIAIYLPGREARRIECISAPTEEIRNSSDSF